MGLVAPGRVVVRRGEVWWASLPEPRSSGPGFRRPVLVIQSNPFNESRIGTVVVAVLTSNMRLAQAPGNVFLPEDHCGLPRDSVINVSQILTVDRAFLTEQVEELDPDIMAGVDAGLRLVLGL
jgi:mRNA interferase MazF